MDSAPCAHPTPRWRSPATTTKALLLLLLPLLLLFLPHSSSSYRYCLQVEIACVGMREMLPYENRPIMAPWAMLDCGDRSSADRARPRRTTRGPARASCTGAAELHRGGSLRRRPRRRTLWTLDALTASARARLPGCLAGRLRCGRAARVVRPVRSATARPVRTGATDQALEQTQRAQRQPPADALHRDPPAHRPALLPLAQRHGAPPPTSSGSSVVPRAQRAVLVVWRQLDRRSRTADCVHRTQRLWPQVPGAVAVRTLDCEAVTVRPPGLRPPAARGGGGAGRPLHRKALDTPRALLRVDRLRRVRRRPRSHPMHRRLHF